MSLTHAQREELKRAMLQRRQALEAETHADADKSREDVYSETAGPVPDTGDSATANLVVDLENAELTRDLDELKQIDAALERLGGGSYGVCARCGRDIDLARLRREPAATRCIDCQRVYEKTFAQPMRSSL